MGYNIAEFRLDLARENLAVVRKSSLSKFNDFSLENIPASISYILDAKIQELMSTAALVDATTVTRAVKLIKNANTILFSAVENSIPVCISSAFKFAQIGLRSSCPSTTESMILASLTLRDNDVVIIVSSSGFSQRLTAVIDNAEDTGAPVIFVTSNPSSDLAKRADLVFCACSRDRTLVGSQFSSHMSAHFIMEVLFLFLTVDVTFAREYARLERKMLGTDKGFSITMN